MAALMEAESTLTDRYQTTIPETVRRALGLGKHDRVLYTVMEDGSVFISRYHNDPALEPFLALLAEDIALRPERLEVVPAGLTHRIDALLGDLDVDLDAPLAEDADD